MERLILILIFIGYANSFNLENYAAVHESISGCALSIGGNGSPMVIQTGQSEFMYPKIGDSSFNIASGDTIDLVCPGNKVNVGSASYDNFISATCVSASTLKINGKNIQWEKISCSATASKTARPTGNTCQNNGKEVEIGFEIADRFLRSIVLCFDESKQQALYSHANITASINKRVESTPRPSWVQGTNIYDITSVSNYYTRTTQRETINAALGLSATSTKYIQDDNNYFLSRGHMTARSDNFYPAQQNASFFLPNVAPQWQTCNDINWYQVEIYVRDYAEAHKVDLLEWTGVYGATTLPHEETGEAVELYLYDKNNRKALPVPEFYWKVAYEPISQKGIAIIIINNPYLTTYKPICSDVSSKVEGLKWDKDNQQKGFGYICTVDSFRKVVTYLPTFTDKGLLL